MADKLNALLGMLDRRKRMLIVVHDNPDPDALASACALAHLARRRAGLRSRITCEGIVGRAENHALLRELRLDILPVQRVAWADWPLIGMVDTQPGAGNNSLPRRVLPHIVIDHHPARRTVKAPFVDVRPSYGSTATILTEYLFAADCPPPPALATGICYAISTDTLDLARGSSDADTETFVRLYPLADKRALGRIRHPKLHASYYSELARAVLNAFTYANIIGSHLGPIAHPDSVALTADLLMQHERMGWAVATGVCREDLYVSLRTLPGRHHAGALLRRVLGSKGHAGGHGTMAGGRVSVVGMCRRRIEQTQRQVVSRLIHILKRQDGVTLRPLIGSTELHEALHRSR